MRTQVALAGRVKAGDVVVVDGEPKRIARIKRAEGRKPAQGENLHLVADDGEIVRVNSSAALRIQLPWDRASVERTAQGRPRDRRALSRFLSRLHGPTDTYERRRTS